jgi:formate dehydrogenase subunit gamma
VPLTADQAETMLQRQFKKHHVAIMLLHWFNAAVWLAELATGVGLVTSRHFRVAPEWYLSVVQGVFGSRANMLQVHITLGLLWMGVFLVYGIFGFRTYLSQEVLQKEIALDKDDIRWLIVRTRQILGLTKDPLPPQGIYNAGQKLFAVMVYLTLPVIMLTGVVMVFHLFGTQTVGWAVVLHFAAVGIVVSGLIIHVYMGAVFPEEKPAFFSMITGTVNELYAYSHHFKWWRELMVEERQWEHAHEGQLGGPPDATGAASAGTPEPISVTPGPPTSEHAADV